MFANMGAELLMSDKLVLGPAAFIQIRVWLLPAPVLGSSHLYKYSLSYVVDRICVLRYDNERGKGDHKHVGTQETPYAFTTPERLLADFRHDVELWRSQP